MIKYGYILPEADTLAFYKFIKMEMDQQVKLLRSEGVVVDGYNEKKTFTKVYFLNGFFVEEIINTDTDQTIDVLPFKQGYKTEKYFEVKEVLTLKKSMN